MANERPVYRVHAIRRMFERGISAPDVRAVVENGEVIEDYPDDDPFPSKLIMGRRDSGPVHVVAA